MSKPKVVSYNSKSSFSCLPTLGRPKPPRNRVSRDLEKEHDEDASAGQDEDEDKDKDEDEGEDACEGEGQGDGDGDGDVDSEGNSDGEGEGEGGGEDEDEDGNEDEEECEEEYELSEKQPNAKHREMIRADNICRQLVNLSSNSIQMYESNLYSGYRFEVYIDF